ncbi:MAG: alanine transaminase [Candidatus Tectomicrobia bacterium RIFCSPLOWO2_12_FULL_69_37]|nr:MAG: alanine transaminase [Candidatus Tectomicrobia bacterium RIFCSPLOWO2_02_FULL_70_19]OGL64326.1 MAG: alanine transaminase [Candidatus Tectomicrobia bacterium RIFCSPLOWO2_12_FULL_69_37]
MHEFQRITRLPPYVFAVVDELKLAARRKGEDIIDFGMGNPDLATPPHIIEKLVEAASNPRNHRYSASRGITKLRAAIASWYGRRYGVEVDPEREAIVTIGVKEGISHLALAITNPGDLVMVPSPTYPIHTYAMVLANGNVIHVPLSKGDDFFENMVNVIRPIWPRPKILTLSFPHNPTTVCVDIEFFKKVVAFAKEYDLIVIHDFAYADLGFDGYMPPSFLQAPGAKDVGVEFFSLSKSYSMAGWRIGFCVGNPQLVDALRKIKSYLDYGAFQPIQIASIIALNGPQECVEEIRQTYERRRDVLCDGLNRIGWPIEKPKGTMFVWSEIPEPYREMGSIEFSKFLIRETQVAVSPGIGFGGLGDGHVRFALVENEHRTRQALRSLRAVFHEKTQKRAAS